MKWKKIMECNLESKWKSVQIKLKSYNSPTEEEDERVYYENLKKKNKGLNDIARLERREKEVPQESFKFMIVGMNMK